MNKTIQIPFNLNNEEGIVEVKYEANESANKSGFHLLGNLGFDTNMCIGYPTMHGYIKEFGGTGYSTCCAWVQVITSEFYSSESEDKPVKIVVEIDSCETMKKIGMPFFAHGYPAQIYDAPCKNIRNYDKLKWTAETFLVTYPSRINNDTITYLAGYRWGYIENAKDEVNMSPIEVIDISVWEKHIPLLGQDCKEFNFK